MELDELFSMLSDALVAIAAVVTAIFAARGLRAWRHELVGRRRYELAEAALVDLSEASEVFRLMRSSFAYESEFEQIKRAEGEGESTFMHRRAYALAAVRYAKHIELFGRLRSTAARVEVFFGQDHGLPIREALLIVDEVLVAGEKGQRWTARLSMLEEREEKSGKDLSKQIERAEQAIAEVDEIYWSTSFEEDPLTSRMREALARANRMFGPILNP